MNQHPAPVAATQHDAAMRGFDAEFRDLDHYVRVITDRIWAEQRIDDIRLYYSDRCVVETGMSVSTDIEAVLTGTRANLAMFPDRRPLAEDMIQSGDEDGGFLSSHRAISAMTHLGDGIFGPATGRRIHVHSIADCVCKDNRIVHEWLVRDQAAIALQIGSTSKTLAQQWLNQCGGWNKPVAGPAPAGYVSHMSTDTLARRFAQVHEGFSRLELAIESQYDDAAQLIGPGERTCYGHAEIAGFWRDMYASLRVTGYTIEHLASQRDMLRSGRPDRVALRFRAQSLHEPRNAVGHRYGMGTGRPVELLGIVHAEFVRGRVVREWLLLDEVATWMQILTPGT